MIGTARRWLRAAWAVGALALGTPGAWAGDLGIPGGFDLDRYTTVLVGAESGGDYSVLNPRSAAAGRYQFLQPPLVDVGLLSGSGVGWSNYSWTQSARRQGVSSLNGFLHTAAGHALQDKAFIDFTLLQWRRLQPSHRTIGSAPRGVTVTPGGLLNAAHFLGAGGMNGFVEAGWSCSGLRNLSAILAQNGFGSVAACTNYVFSRLEDGAEAHPGGAAAGGGAGFGDDEGFAEVPSLGLMCQQVAIMDTAGEQVSSPFGVDRTGRASAGYHVGLDLINGQGRGAPLKAGIPGRVIQGPGGTTNAFMMQTPDGRQRFGYLHNQTVSVRAGMEVTPDMVVATMGDRGSPGAVHLHLTVLLRADVVQAAAESVGRVWSAGAGYGNKGAPLSSAAVQAGGLDTYYVVNPEPFLHHRVPFRAGLLTAQQYVDQGLVRPDGLTLPNTCGPSAEELAGSGSLRSQTGGSVVGGGLTETGTGLITAQQVPIAIATEEARDAVIEYATAAMGGMHRRQMDGQGATHRAATWAAAALAVGSDLETPPPPSPLELARQQAAAAAAAR